MYRAGRLAVLPGHKDPTDGLAYTGRDYTELISCLTRFFTIALADCGTGLAEDAMRAVLDHTDVLVIAATPTPDAVAMAEDTHAWLATNGYERLACNSIAALCHTTAVQPASAYALRHCLIGRCRAVAEIPTDAHLSEGGTIDPARLSTDTRAAYVRLADARCSMPTPSRAGR